MSTVELPAAWAKAKRVDITQRKDKSELVGTPFLITAFQLTFGATYEGIRVRCENIDGTVFEFTDASTGVKAQLCDLLESLGYSEKMSDVGAGEIPIPNGIVIDGGLSVSEYEREVDGRKIPARTYYLVASK